MRTQACRIENWLLRIDETSRLSASVKLPSKSPSRRPVNVNRELMSGNSKLVPIRAARALRWKLGSFVGPVLVTVGVDRNNPGNGMSSPFGLLSSYTADTFRNPYGVIFTGPTLNAAFNPSFT